MLLIQTSGIIGKFIGHTCVYSHDAVQFIESDPNRCVSFVQELLVSQNDLGRDYEHCLELQKKVNNQESAVSCHFLYRLPWLRKSQVRFCNLSHFPG